MGTFHSTNIYWVSALHQALHHAFPYYNCSFPFPISINLCRNTPTLLVQMSWKKKDWEEGIHIYVFPFLPLAQNSAKGFFPSCAFKITYLNVSLSHFKILNVTPICFMRWGPNGLSWPFIFCSQHDAPYHSVHSSYHLLSTLAISTLHQSPTHHEVPSFVLCCSIWLRCISLILPSGPMSHVISSLWFLWSSQAVESCPLWVSSTSHSCFNWSINHLES